MGVRERNGLAPEQVTRIVRDFRFSERTGAAGAMLPGSGTGPHATSNDRAGSRSALRLPRDPEELCVSFYMSATSIAAVHSFWIAGPTRHPPLAAGSRPSRAWCPAPARMATVQALTMDVGGVNGAEPDDPRSLPRRISGERSRPPNGPRVRGRRVRPSVRRACRGATAHPRGARRPDRARRRS